MTSPHFKAELLDLLASDPEVRAAVRAILDTPRDAETIRALLAHGGADPTAIQIAREAAERIEAETRARTTRRGKDHIAAHVPWHPAARSQKSGKPQSQV